MQGTARAIGLSALSVLVAAAWAWPSPPRPQPPKGVDVPILMYHRIGREPSGPPITDALTVSAADFTAQMEWLRRAGFHAITQGQLVGALLLGAPLPSRPVLVTFDDGYRDVLWNAAPLLYRLDMPATVYVITDRVEAGDPSFLTWAELRRLERVGFDIGSHTIHHVALTRVPPLALKQELQGSKRILERHLGRPVPWFAYPVGDFNASVAAEVRRAGYLLAVTTRPGDAQTNPMTLHRYRILDSTGLRGLEALLASQSQ